MGRRGPAPTPVAILRARGETRPSRVNYDAPVPRQRAPRMPADMDDDAKPIWKRVMASMGDTMVITEADGELLRVYCETVVRYRRASKMLMASTPLLTVSRRRGEVVKNPLYAIVRDLSDTMIRFARELGLSPAARVSLMRDPGATSAFDIEDVIGPPPRLLA